MQSALKAAPFAETAPNTNNTFLDVRVHIPVWYVHVPGYSYVLELQV